MKTRNGNQHEYEMIIPYFHFIKSRNIGKSKNLAKEHLVQLLDTEFYYVKKSRRLQNRMVKTLHKIITGDSTHKTTDKLRQQASLFDSLYAEHETFNKIILESIALN